MTPVIVNTTAGSGRAERELEALRRLFAEAGVEVEVLAARDGATLQELVAQAMRGSPPLVVAGGGDGTVSAVAQAARGTRTAVAILPLGTLNHFARDLGIPLALADAVKVAIRGRPAAVDLGEVNGEAFLNNSSIGIYADVVRDRTRQQRKLGRSRSAAMLWAILASVRRAPLLSMRLELDGETRELRAPFVFVGNNDYLMHGFRIDRRERVDTGRLSVYTTRRSTPSGLYRLALRAIFHRLRQAEDFSAALVRRLTVQLPHKRVLVAIDGEVRAMETPLEYRILPRALAVMVPQAQPAR
jgi:YegS/Rv2252/BmrU family lipid kinase